MTLELNNNLKIITKKKREEKKNTNQNPKQNCKKNSSINKRTLNGQKFTFTCENGLDAICSISTNSL